MSFIARFLALCTAHGRSILAGSLVVGIIGGPLATLIKPHIEILIGLLLFIASLRVGPKQAFGAIREIKVSLIFTLCLQVLLPLIFVFIIWMINFDHPLGLALILLTAAPALSGSPHLVALLGFDPAPALRQLIVGTAFLPLTVIPVFFLLPEIGDLNEILISSGRLLLIIFAAASSAFVIRLTLLKELNEKAILNVDGVSTILLAIIVVGLMAAIQDEIIDNPLNLLLTLVFAIGVNFGLQILTTTLLKKSAVSSSAVPIGIIAGNRNIALFLTALPATITDSLLLFIACYQIPMYMTPIVLRKFYQSVSTFKPNK